MVIYPGLPGNPVRNWPRRKGLVILIRIVFQRVLDDAEKRVEEVQRRELAETERKGFEQEILAAAEIQRGLTPRFIPRHLADVVAKYTRPARGASGDYIDILLQARTGCVTLVIADVAGKGMPAAVVMVIIRTILHTIHYSVTSPAEILKWLNRGLVGQLDFGRFATACVISYDPRSGKVVYSNAAHPPILHRQYQSGDVHSLDTDGPPLGIDRESVYESRSLNLARGDSLLLYTDGVSEAIDSQGRMFGEERLVALFKSLTNASVVGVIQAIQAELENHSGGAVYRDDLTLALVRHR